MVFSGIAAKASLISKRSMSPIVMPAFARQRCVAGVGAGQHDDRLGRGRRHRDDARARPQAVRLRVGRRRDQHGARAVDDARRVPGVVHVLDASRRRGAAGRARRRRARSRPSARRRRVPRRRAAACRGTRASCRRAGARRGRARSCPSRSRTGTRLPSKRPSFCATSQRRWLSAAKRVELARGVKPSSVAIRSAEMPCGTSGCCSISARVAAVDARAVGAHRACATSTRRRRRRRGPAGPPSRRARRSSPPAGRSRRSGSA